MITRLALVCVVALALGSGRRAVAEDGCTLAFEPELPPLTRQASVPALAELARATTQPIARALARAEAERHADHPEPPWRLFLHQLALAARLAPDDVLPRVELLRLLELAPAGAIDGCEDAVVDAWRGRLALELARCAYAGSTPCLRSTTAWLFGERRPFEGDVAALAPALALLREGPPGPTADAARRALAWLMGSSGADGGPPPLAPRLRVAGERATPRRLEAIWWGAEGGEDHEATPGEAATGNWHRPLVWSCAGACCDMPFQDRGPHSRQVTRLCFDAKWRLTELDWQVTDIP